MKINIFVSYSHMDASYLDEDSLLGYLDVLQDEQVEFWTDKVLVTGDDWDEEIKDRINNANIALVLVSQMFLKSSYCKNVEISGFLRQRRESGLVIFPVILSACEWQRHEWLSSTQFLPKGGKTIEKDYKDPGDRKDLFFAILQDLRAQVKRVRQRSQEPSHNLSAIPDNTSRAAQSDPHSADDKCRAELAKWVDKILTNHLPESGAFDWQILPPSGEPGGVWLQSQCLTGVLCTAAGAANADKARLTFEYIQKFQKDDGGWAYSGNAKDTVTVTDVSCWVTAAYATAAQAGIWKSNDEGGAAARAVERAFQHILARRSADGGWCPAGDVIPANTRTYTTAMAIWCLFLTKNTPALSAGTRFDREITEGTKWLLKNRRNDLGWVPNPNRAHQRDKHPGLNSQVLFILMQLENGGFQLLRNDPFFQKWKQEFLADRTWRALDFFQNSSIRDADQWLDEYRIEGSSFLWCPWTLAALHSLSVDSGLSDEECKQAVSLRREVIQKILDQSDYIGTNGTYELAETITCVAYALS